MMAPLPLWDHGEVLWQWCTVVGAALAAALCDMRNRRIPNLLTGPVLAGGLCFATCVGGPAGFAESIGGCIVASLPFVLLFIWAGGGAGDAKIMGAIGAWVGLIGGAVVVVCVALAGGLLALLWAWRGHKLRSALANVRRIVAGAVFTLRSPASWRGLSAAAPGPQAPDGMPYGLAILLGTCLASGVVWLARM